MEVSYTDIAKADLQYWKGTHNSKIQTRISQLILSIQQDPFKGLGKPEPLKHQFKGCWSRRIDRKNRLIYEIQDNRIFILSLKGHYKTD